MLVIGIGTPGAPSGEVVWSGRRHDDDAAGASTGTSSQDLFDAVFHALHDGEQVAVGAAGTLSTALPEHYHDDEDHALALLTGAEAEVPDTGAIRVLLDELGRWRPWTVVSTSLPRWRATTSVLIWRIDAADVDAGVVDAAVEAFYARVQAGSADSAPNGEGAFNLPAAIALRAGLGVDTAQLTEPILSITPR